MLIWNEKYRIGVPELDSQHMIIFGILAQMHGALDAGTAEELADDLLRGLRDFAAFHLRHEEVYMERIGFPGLQDHVRRHEELMELMERLLEDDSRSGAEKVMAGEELVTRWFIDHIFEDDSAIARFAGRIPGAHDGFPGGPDDTAPPAKV